MKYKTRLTFKIYLTHLKKYKWPALALFVFTVLGAVSNLIGPLLYKNFFDILAEPDIMDKTARLTGVILAVLEVMVASWVFWRAASFISNHVFSRTMADLADTCFSYLHKHSFAFFSNNFVGSLVKRVNRFYNAFVNIFAKIIWDLVPLGVEVIIISIILFRKSPVLGIAVVIWIIFFGTLNYLFTIFKLKYDIARSELDTKVTGMLADTITNHSNVKLFCGYERETALFNKINNQRRKLRKLTWDLGDLIEGVQAALMIGLEFGVFYIAVGLWEKGILTIGDFVLIQAYLLTIFHKFWNFGRIIRDFYEQLADAEEMTEILDTPHEIKDSKRAKKLIVKKGAIEFKNVYFYYHKTRKVIEKFNLEISAGQRVALVGPSGAGKSTIIKLLLRMHDLSRGKILIDGQNISQVTQDSLHLNISLVPQDPILFHRTLMENIRYGMPAASDKDVIRASKLAHCHKFISCLPKAYETYVGERGVKLSGGERQRVAIARAILRDAPILILDEATSSLDSESEKLIQDALDNLMKGKTVIVIAHRLSTIMKMDRIVVINEGKIIEDGAHKKLTRGKKGLYYKLWKAQAGGFVE